MLIRNAPDGELVAPQLRRRLRWVIGFGAAALLVLVGRLWQLQVIRGDRYFQRTLSNVVQESTIPAVRGKILDRRGVPLADNRPAFNIYVTPARFDAADERALAHRLHLDDDERSLVHERLAAGRKRSASRPVLILDDQSRDRAALVAQAKLELPGVEVRDEPYRYYPHGKLAAHLIGYMNQLTAKEATRLASRGYDPSEMIGRYGIERQWEHYLRGKKGIQRFVVNARGDRVDTPSARALIHGPRFVPPVAGHNIVLTIDYRLQKIAEAAASAHAAAAIVAVQPDSGRLLAMVSQPSFDPNVMTGHLTHAELKQLDSDPRKPFIDKTVRQQYPPGSTFKFVTAIAALQDHLVDTDEVINCPGYLRLGRRIFHCDAVHGKTTMITAIEQSCDVYFWTLSERVGLDRMAEVAREFGLGAPTGLGINGEVPGRVPDKAWYKRRGTFQLGYTLNAAIGQGDVAVTVLQLAMAYAALVNGGDLYVPQVVERVESASGEVIASFAPKLRRHVQVAAATLAVIRRGLELVVNGRKGTAYGARSDRVRFAGKTGTAQVRSHRQNLSDNSTGWDPARPDAWFVGYAPLDHPKIVVAVLIPHGGRGGVQAAPVARAVIEGYLTKVLPAEQGTLPGTGAAP